MTRDSRKGCANLHVLFVLQGIDRHRTWESIIIVRFLTDDVQTMGVHHESVQERAWCDLRKGLACTQGRGYQA